MNTTLISKYPEQVSKLFFYFKQLDINTQGNDVKTFKEFLTGIEEFSERISDDIDIRKKFKGDMLEIFSEVFFTLFENDPEIGIKNYKPISIDQDFGCDAEGINVNGDRVAVQVKFRSNPLDCVTYEELAKTDTSARRLLKIDTSKKDVIYIFTSAFDLSNAAKTVLDDSLVFMGFNQISYKVDNNKNFWDNAWELIKGHN